MRWDGVRAGKGKGHWRLSSVSDRENAVTTSSAPENHQEITHRYYAVNTVSCVCERGGTEVALSCCPAVITGATQAVYKQLCKTH